MHRLGLIKPCDISSQIKFTQFARVSRCEVIACSPQEMLPRFSPVARGLPELEEALRRESAFDIASADSSLL